MDELLTTIHEIIKPRFQVKLKQGKYILEEDKQPNYPKTPLKTKGKTLIYNFDIEDSNRAVFPIFNPNRPTVASICDYIIFHPKHNCLFTFLCDLKTGKSSAKNQAEGGYVLAQYIIKTAQRLLKFKDFNIEYRALVLSQSKTAHFSTNPKKQNYITLEHSQLKNQLLKTGNIIHLDNLCI